VVGVKVVVVVGMEEDIEEKLVEELVVKWVEMEAGQGGSTAMGAAGRSLLAGNGEGMEKMKEREGKGVFI